MSGDTCIECGKPTLRMIPRVFYDHLDEEMLDIDVPCCLECDSELCRGFDVDRMSIKEIEELIKDKKLAEQDLVEYYGNEDWRNEETYDYT